MVPHPLDPDPTRLSKQQEHGWVPQGLGQSCSFVSVGAWIHFTSHHHARLYFLFFFFFLNTTFVWGCLYWNPSLSMPRCFLLLLLFSIISSLLFSSVCPKLLTVKIEPFAFSFLVKACFVYLYRFGLFPSHFTAFNDSQTQSVWQC